MLCCEYHRKKRVYLLVGFLSIMRNSDQGTTWLSITRTTSNVVLNRLDKFSATIGGSTKLWSLLTQPCGLPNFGCQWPLLKSRETREEDGCGADGLVQSQPLDQYRRSGANAGLDRFWLRSTLIQSNSPSIYLILLFAVFPSNQVQYLQNLASSVKKRHVIRV